MADQEAPSLDDFETPENSPIVVPPEPELDPPKQPKEITAQDIRYATYNGRGTIDLQYNHPEFGWIPFTAGSDDPEPLGVQLYDLAIQGTIAPYAAPPAPPYQIAKTTPWLRMTDAEGELVYAAMQETSSRLRAIYDAATYLSSGDPLWQTLHDILAATLTPARADHLLAPET
jgi:hypothetical protein